MWGSKGNPERLAVVGRDNIWGVGDAPKPNMTEVPPALPPLCRKCRRVIASAHKFCPHCGQRQDLGSAWYYHPVWILLLAFLALGPLAIPLVWRSRQMSVTGKIVMTVAILLYTVYCGYFAWKMGAIYWKFSTDLGNAMREIHPR